MDIYKVSTNQDSVNTKSFLAAFIIVTFKDLQKAVQSQSQQSGPELNTIPKDIPFWIFDKEQHRFEDTNGVFLDDLFNDSKKWVRFRLFLILFKCVFKVAD